MDKVVLILFVLGIIGMICLAAGVGQPPIQMYRYDLVQANLSKNQNINGSFIFGCGGISSEDEIYYLFYIKDKTGKINLIKANSVDVSIYEDGGCFAEGESRKYGEYDSYSTWTIHVPKNTLKNLIKINIDEIKE